MFKTIALQGRGNSGKTKTLSVLISMINFDEPPDIKSVNESEKWVVGKSEGIKVAITTQGDCGEQLKKWIEYIDSITDEVDIYICPCRTRGSSFDFVYNHFKPQNVIFNGKWYVEKYGAEKNAEIEALQESANRIQAEALMKIIFDFKQESEEK